MRGPAGAARDSAREEAQQVCGGQERGPLGENGPSPEHVGIGVRRTVGVPGSWVGPLTFAVTDLLEAAYQ